MIYRTFLPGGAQEGASEEVPERAAVRDCRTGFVVAGNKHNQVKHILKW
jgi:hypothetical protein